MKPLALHTARILRVLFTLALFFLVSSCKSSVEKSTREAIQIPNGYKLIWHDEFNSGAKPDAAYWSYENGFVRNEELQWYQSENAIIQNGNLRILGKKESVKNDRFYPESNNWKESREFAEYTSASINTRGKFDFQFGILEVKAKIDTSMGMWPAIWTLGIEKGWPSNGEIDVMEYYLVDQKPAILANAAWKGATSYVSWDSEKIPFSKFLKNIGLEKFKKNISKIETDFFFIFRIIRYTLLILRQAQNRQNRPKIARWDPILAKSLQLVLLNSEN